MKGLVELKGMPKSRWLKLAVKIMRWMVLTLLLIVAISRFILPVPSFDLPTTTVIEASNGTLIGARIATDGQWRFPKSDSIPKQFEICLLNFEDRYFRHHPGINPVSLGRSLKVNLERGGIVQGGSTITMQVARLLRNGKVRTYFQKMIEMAIALHLEINLSKDEILSLYASNAPFGGNVVGLDAAAWRYFGRAPFELTWAEYAVLAVLPNAPSLIYPGKNHDVLKQKRDRLLDVLLDRGLINEELLKLSKLEPLPEKPRSLPHIAPHALDRIHARHTGKRIKTSLDLNIQKRTQSILNNHVGLMSSNEIYNAAAIILKVKDGKIISYVGNSTLSKDHDNDVDIVKASRSTGSILKPFLYATSLTAGEILPNMLVPDIPTYIAGYAPKNYFPSFDGAVRADEALYRSLNVPFVHMLRKHGVDIFYNELKHMRMSSLVYPSSHYGLSLILGGAEAKLIDLANMYAGMSRTLINHGMMKPETNNYFSSDLTGLKMDSLSKSINYISAGAAYHTFEAMTQVNRPVSENGWKSFQSSRKIAWKTGTSFGNKDAWAIGVTPEYVVAVWVGNADGEGRPGLTGVTAAAPLMLDLFDLLGPSSWFDIPYEEVINSTICSKSGYRSSEYCEKIDTVYLPVSNNKTFGCPYHRLVHLSNDEKWQVNTDCESPLDIKHKKWFSLPPIMEWYYKRKAAVYQTLPPYRSDCLGQDQNATMEFIYPKNTNKIYIPIELDGSKGSVVFEVAHRNLSKRLYWHMDGVYIGFTKDFHQMAINGTRGRHELIVVDEDGVELVKGFTIMND